MIAIIIIVAEITMAVESMSTAVRVELGRSKVTTAEDTTVEAISVATLSSRISVEIEEATTATSAAEVVPPATPDQ